jgi:hypothetical protein
MSLRILTDEHISPQISHRLTALGYEVVCVRDRGLLRYEDWDLIRWCIDHQHAISPATPEFVRPGMSCLRA